MTRVTFLCHGSTAATRTGSFPQDEPLEPLALRRLAVIAPFRAAYDRGWTSPARRAVQTCEALGLQAAPEPRLRDCDFGAWAGRSLDDIQASEPERLMAWLTDAAAAPHGGEAMTDVLARVADWLGACGRSPERVVAVTHPSVIKAAVVLALGAPAAAIWRVDISPLSVTELSGDPGRWTVLRANSKMRHETPMPEP